MVNEPKHIKVGELEIPIDYWSMTEEDKIELNLVLLDAMLTLLDKQLNPDFDRLVILDKLLESSIESNEEEENYEICEVMKNIRTLLNEQTR